MTKVTRQILGERLKDVRKFLGMTQGDVAEKINAKQTTVSRIEAGGDVGTESTLDLLCFYAKLIQIEVLFEELYDSTNIRNKGSVVNAIAAEKLKKILVDVDIEEKRFEELYHEKVAEVNDIIHFIEEKS